MLSHSREQSNTKENCLSCHGIQEWVGVLTNNGYLIIIKQLLNSVYLVTGTVKGHWARGPMQTVPVYIPTPGS